MSGAAQAQELRLADGRALAYALYGAPLAGAKAVIIYHHGVPASHVEVEPLGKAAAPLGVAVVAVERSGMGGSAPNPKMSVQSVAEDVRQLMDALSIPSAAQVGESGGGPYAAACAALLPQRTSSLVLLASVAAVDGRERRALLRDVGLPDRWCMNTIPGRLGGNRVINWLLRRLATVSAELPAECERPSHPAALVMHGCLLASCRPAAAAAAAKALWPIPRPASRRAENAGQADRGRRRCAGPLRR